MKALTISILLVAGCHDPVCPAVPLSGQWQGYEDAIPKGAVVCGPDKIDPRKLLIQYPDKTPHEADLLTADGTGHWVMLGNDVRERISFVTLRAQKANEAKTDLDRATAVTRAEQWIEFKIETQKLPNKGTFAELELHRR